MSIYIFLFFLNFIFCIIGYNNNRFDKVGSLLLMLFMCLLCCLRDLDCGTDTINYHRIFFYNTELSDQRLEPLFLLARNYISDFQLFLAFFALLNYSIVYYVCAKEVRYISLAILIFMISPTKFFPETFNIIRQSTASAFILWGFMKWNNRKILYTIILFSIATLFHYSSIIAFSCLLIPRSPISYKFSLVAVLVTLFCGISGVVTIAIQNFVVALGEADLHPIITTYAHYGLKIHHTMQFSSLVLWLFPLSLFAITCYPQKKEAKLHYGYYYNVFLIGVILGNLFIPPLDSGLRFVFSIMIVQIIVVPVALKYAGMQQKALIAGSVLICAASYLFYIYHLQYYSEVSIVPYKSIIW